MCISIRLGANSNVQDCAVLHGMRYKHPVEVGDWVTIGHNATVHGCVIEDACLIGMGATILNNARIGEGSIIAAGAVITENTVVPANTLWAGVPAKERRRLDPKDRESILQYARNYVDYTATYLKEREKLVGADLGPFDAPGFVSGARIALVRRMQLGISLSPYRRNQHAAQPSRLQLISPRQSPCLRHRLTAEGRRSD